jgi:hypothetical protein
MMKATELLRQDHADVMLQLDQLRDAVQRHVAEEERSIFAAAERLGVDETPILPSATAGVRG